MYFPINLTGGEFRDKSGPVSNQITRNFWPRIVDDSITKNKYILDSWVGQTLFGTCDHGKGRGTFFHNSILYRVCGNALYSVDSAGVHTYLGIIPGDDKCIFDAMGTSLIIVADRRVFVWDGATLTENTDPDLESPDSVTVINNQALYDGEGGRFGVSNVGDPLSIDGLSYATAESRADNLVRVYAFDQSVYMLGDLTIEQWWNSGVGKPPFDRVQGGIIEKGIASLHGVANSVDFLYVFGNDRKLYKIKGSTAVPVTDSALVTIFEGFTTVSDVIVWCMDLRDKNFTVITFPTENKTYVLPDGGQWFEWSSGVDGGRNIANSYVKAYHKNLVEDYRNGNIYELNFESYTENGNTIVRQRDSAPLAGIMFGVPGKTVAMNKFVLNIQTGVGLLSGQGSDPVVMLSYSDDGGETFSTERWATIGKMGKFKWKAEWNNLGSFDERIIRIRTSDPVYYCIRDAGAEMEFGI